tara:strand:+ start:1688 stop:2155 length:468 start_codon:yes stop_codon:yes gene_type:complete
MSEEIKIIDGTYKKDNPHQDIGKQKFRVKKFYNVEVDYEVVANSKEEAEDAVQEHGGIEKIEWQDGYYGDEPVEMKYYDHNWDQQAEIDYEKYGREPRVQKIEECVPYEDWDSETDVHFDNYEDPDWTTDSYRWKKEELETSDQKVKTKESEIPF